MNRVWSMAMTMAVILAAAYSALPGLASRPGQTARSRQSVHRTVEEIPNPAASLHAQAQAAFDKKDYASAVKLFTQYLNDAPDDAIGHFQLGYAYTALQQWDNAEAQYRKAAQLNPKLAPAQLNLGLILLQHDPAAAVSPLQEAVALEPKQAQPHFLLGMALENSGQPAQAVTQFRASLKLDPNDFNTQMELAHVLLSLRQPAQAETAFRGALAMQPDSVPAQFGLADALLEEGKNAEGMAALQTYLKERPTDETARLELAGLMKGAGHLNAALAQLAMIHTSGPNALAADRLRGRILLQQKKYADAVSPLRAAVALAPKDAVLQADLGHALLKQEDFAAAAQTLTSAVQLNPKMTAAWSDLTEALYLTGQWAEALDALNHVEQTEPLTSLAWFVRATCYDHLGRIAPAIAAYKAFLDMDNGKLATDEELAQRRLPVLEDLLRRQKK